MLQCGSWIYRIWFTFVVFSLTQYATLSPCIESSGHVGIDHASELHLRLQEVDNDQDAVKMNTQRDVKITIVNIDSVDSTP